MSQVSVDNKTSFWQNPLSWLLSLWEFSRPHTIVGTSLSVFALYLIALSTQQTGVNFENIINFLVAWIACLCGNIYIVGLNQLEDIKIDQINKPHLPLAAGDFSITQGRWIVATTGILSLIISGISSYWLLGTVGISLIIGTAYSLPPIRLKRFPFFAAFCILTVRGIIVNLGLFLYFIHASGEKAFLVPEVLILTGFVVVFTIAIAIFKDVPDLEGDQEYNITTFTLLLGKSTIFKIACSIIIVCYLAVIIIGFLDIIEVKQWFLIGSHFCLLGLLLWRSQIIDLDDKGSIAKFYQFIWRLFFLEYILFPLSCLIK